MAEPEFKPKSSSLEGVSDCSAYSPRNVRGQSEESVALDLEIRKPLGTIEDTDV